MKKTVTINLNSFIFNIDEDAYNELRDYLDKLELHFSGFDEGGEIVKDIEARLAEIFNMKITDNKQVINISDVEEVISILGNVEDIIGNEDQEENKGKNKNKKKKKIYRDTDNKIIAGICSGLAAYTGIDVVIIRILFLVFLIIPGNISLIAYLILWIAVPEARTISQKIEMKGEPVDLSNIEKTAKKTYENVKKNLNNVNTGKFSETLETIGRTIIEILGVIFRLLGKILGLVAVVLGAVLMAALIIVVLTGGNNTYFPMSAPFDLFWLPGLLQYFTSPVMAWVISICIAIVVIIPIIAIIYWGVLLLFRVKGSRFFNLGTFLLWIICLTIVITSLLMSIGFNRVEERIVVNEEIKINKEKPVYYFNLTPGKDKLPHKPRIFFNVKKKNPGGLGNGELRGYPSIEFTYTDDTIARIKLKYTSYGKDMEIANEALKKIEYNYTITDSVTYFDPYFSVPAADWSFQDLYITVYMPEGSIFKVDENLENLVNFFPYIFDYYSSENKILITTKDGFEIASKFK
ncbi:MAG: PspC domain-containing protein [Bacteroidales bacterium]|jgi:phage shock protein PspC (stress-responsive transcriptional regulator)|nr:PspC domain-containing protein [Bacteroidales bacterium]